MDGGVKGWMEGEGMDGGGRDGWRGKGWMEGEGMDGGVKGWMEG